MSDGAFEFCRAEAARMGVVMNLRRYYRNWRGLGAAWAARTGCVCVLAAAAMSASAARSAVSLSEQHFERGNENYRSGAYFAAITDYTEAIRIDPTHAMAYIGRALSRTRVGKINEAIADYSAAINVDPQSQVAYNNRGYLKLNQGDNDGAIADFNKALEIYARSFMAYFNRGKAKLNKGEYDAAIADITAAIKIDPRPADPYYQRASARIKIGDTEGAIADFTEAIRGDSSYAPAYNSRGLALFEKGDYDGAIGDYNRAIRVDPNYVAAYNNRGIAEHKRGRYDNAIADFDELIRMAPQHAGAYANRASVKKDKGDYSGAIADFTKAIGLAPRDALSHRRRGHLYYDAARWLDSLKDLSMATQLEGNGHGEDYDLLRIWLASSRLGERGEATALLEAHLKNGSGGQIGVWYKSLCAFLLGRSSVDELIRAADDPEFKKANERRCEAYFLAGSVRIIEGDIKEGMRLLRQCLATMVTDFTEYASARSELESILIGTHFESVGEEARRSVVLDTDVGLSVWNVVRGGPAELAGLAEKDIVAAIDGRPATFESIRHLCEVGKPGETVKLSIVRQQRPMNVTLTLGGAK